MDRHVWQRLAIVVLAALIALSTDIFSPADNGNGLGITTIQVRKKTHQLPNLLGQQVAILAGPDTNPNRVREQSVVDSLTYGIVKSDGTVPAGTSENHSYPVTNNRGKEISLFFRADKKKATVKYTNHGEKLHTKAAPLSRLVE